MAIFDKKWFPIIATMLCMFGGPGVLLFIGYPQSDAGGSAIFRIHPLGYFLILLTIYNVIRYNYFVGIFKEYWGYTICVAIVLIYSLTYGTSKGNLFLFNVLFCPALVIYNFQFMDIKRWRQVMLILKIFFYSDCVLAILENVFRFKLFPINETAILFRSNAFQGHPLNNSLFLIFFGLFFYAYEKNFVRQMIIIALTVGALASFGVRSGLVAFSLGITLLSLKFVENGKLNFSMKNIATLVILFVSVIYIVFYTSLGTRITAVGSFQDNSTEVRFGAYSLFLGISWNEIIWGTPQELIDYLMYIYNIKIIENFWIIWVLKYGIVFTAYLAVYFIIFLFKITKLGFPWGLYNRYAVLGCFLIAASSNNSLAVNTMVVNAMTILCMAQYRILHADKKEKAEKAARMVRTKSVETIAIG
ncbi:VpsF family polysaccharide biosynthesis protein [Dyadobacter sediminis]|uniref:O-antigen ligase family protein n=1 Tax=Dyadobacter sediminis TaxID=1493691 RepID=A0A5R9KFE3_9BACT|nr:VpsF family polysaccharide biosynthesis protein [Dyadobacter sediminis]TLU94797.1 hypothetical protein FEM55_11290 [Dyadobacter sediminis]GGB88070.1 hypothetical protein GCM10011325_14510 [Dyadobacter sediminis]